MPCIEAIVVKKSSFRAINRRDINRIRKAIGNSSGGFYHFHYRPTHSRTVGDAQVEPEIPKKSRAIYLEVGGMIEETALIRNLHSSGYRMSDIEIRGGQR